MTNAEIYKLFERWLRDLDGAEGDPIIDAIRQTVINAKADYLKLIVSEIYEQSLQRSHPQETNETLNAERRLLETQFRRF